MSAESIIRSRLREIASSIETLESQQARAQAELDAMTRRIEGLKAEGSALRADLAKLVTQP